MRLEVGGVRRRSFALVEIPWRNRMKMSSRTTHARRTLEGKLGCLVGRLAGQEGAA
jgi:hypothetical protein